MIFVLIITTHSAFAQQLDTTVFEHLLRADKDEFVTYAKSVGLTTDYDSVSNTLFAKKQGIVYSKPLTKKGGGGYEVEMIVSTLEKKNNSLVLKNARPVEGKKDTWSKGECIYIEWETENPVTKEMWYRVVIYKIAVPGNHR